MRVYTPKLEKSMKFVAHDATIAHYFMANRVVYILAQESIVNNPRSTDENQAKAEGFLSSLTNEQVLVDLYFLGTITRILKQSSTEFQVKPQFTEP